MAALARDLGDEGTGFTFTENEKDHKNSSYRSAVSF